MRTVALLGVSRLVELQLEAARNLEEGNEPIAVVFNLLCELDTSCTKLGYRLADVVAVERDVGSSRYDFAALRRVNSEISLWCVQRSASHPPHRFRPDRVSP